MKTNYTRKIIDNYCVLDTETTGFSAYYDEVIEIGILRVRNNQVVEQYQQLIKPTYPIDAFITQLTGITNEMVEGMPSILEVKNQVLSFICDDTLLGHNTSFDIRFLSAGFDQPIDNEYMDTMQFSRKLFPELSSHRLSDMTKYLGLSPNGHRSIADCIATKELYDTIKQVMSDKNLQIKDLWPRKYPYKAGSIDISAITPDSLDFDEDNYFFDKHVVFTGTLERMPRRVAMQMVVNLGGKLDNGVTKETNCLILGDNDYNPILKGAKSSKQKKAEHLKLSGQEIDIIDERTFYDILEESSVLAP